jgi:AraC-like DNA-binding protein
MFPCDAVDYIGGRRRTEGVGLSARSNLLDIRPATVARVERARIPASFFHTDTLAPDERFAAWRESVGVFLESRLSPQADPARFHGNVESYLLDDVVLSRPRAGGQKFDRPSGRIARDGIDHYMIQLFVRGNTDISLARRRLHGGEKRIVGFDLGEVLDSFNADFDILCVIVPRARLAPLLDRPDSVHTQMPSPESGGGHLLAEFLPTLFETLPDLAPSQSASASRALTELIATAFNGAEFAAGDTPAFAERALELKAKRFVKNRLAERTLGPEEIAAASGLSRSALYRLFKESGGVALYIREQRLRRCFADLVSRRDPHVQVAQIAWRWGFSDAAHFSRLFKERFGCTPSEARELAGLRAGPQAPRLDPRIGDRRYEEWIAGLA